MGKVNTAFKSSIAAKGLTKGKDRLKKLKEGTTALKDKPNSMNTNMKNFATYFSGDAVAKGASKLNRKDIKAGLKAGKQHLKNAKMKDLVDAIGKKFGYAYPSKSRAYGYGGNEVISYCYLNNTRIIYALESKWPKMEEC